GSQATGKRPEFAFPEEVAMAARRFAGGQQSLPQAEVAAQRQGRGLGVQEPVRADLHLKCIAAFGPDSAARAVALFENRHGEGGGALLEPISERESRNASTGDDNLGHPSPKRNASSRRNARRRC